MRRTPTTTPHASTAATESGRNAARPAPAQTSAATAPGGPDQPTGPDLMHEPVLARALLAAWSGDRVVVIASPPGAGKTRLITTLAHQLHQRAGLRVAIAAQTRTQALDVARRVHATGTLTHLLGKRGTPRPTDLPPAATWAPSSADLARNPGVVVATTARWAWTPEATWTADVLLVDEAWQCTFADLCTLGSLAAQVVLVGDPGQIDPVVTGDTDRWEHLPTGPHLPAPTAILADPRTEATLQHLPHTYRLGATTTALLQPLYPHLPFTSARPPSTLTSPEGTPLPEIATTTLDGLASRTDPRITVTVEDAVRRLLTGHTVTTTDPDTRTDRDRPLASTDVAVVVPHVEQAALVAARLSDITGLLIGTANQVQGLERHATVVVHPLTGYRTLPAFALATGRLCVSLSRHRSHTTVITDSHTPHLLAGHHPEHVDTGSTSDVAAHIAILSGLTR